ncbi:MAG: ferric reductase-like transmembrane domain-containing protein [Sulfitobacter sp.]
MSGRKGWASRQVAIWCVLALAIVLPVATAAYSPLLAWRDPIYIIGGFAGVVALTLLLVQPMLASNMLPGLTKQRGRQIHKWTGALLVLLVILHVGALWITSPPDVVDALLFASPTPFSAWGVTAMWALFAAAFVAVFRRRFQLAVRVWRRIHTGLTSIVVLGSVIHAIRIDGTMETLSKTVLCGLVVIVAARALKKSGAWKVWWPTKGRNG